MDDRNMTVKRPPNYHSSHIISSLFVHTSTMFEEKTNEQTNEQTINYGTHKSEN